MVHPRLSLVKTARNHLTTAKGEPKRLLAGGHPLARGSRCKQRMTGAVDGSVAGDARPRGPHNPVRSSAVEHWQKMLAHRIEIPWAAALPGELLEWPPEQRLVRCQQIDSGGSDGVERVSARREERRLPWIDVSDERDASWSCQDAMARTPCRHRPSAPAAQPSPEAGGSSRLRRNGRRATPASANRSPRAGRPERPPAVGSLAWRVLPGTECRAHHR